jgi:isoquinoline 1-oxidoreductase alpha subunit
MKIDINGIPTQVDADPAMPLLWVLRDVVGLTGTKYGCGIAACGACTVLVDDVAARSCVVPVQAAAGRRVDTVERTVGAGDDRTGSVLAALREAWVQEQVPQCGYCQSGMLMSATALLLEDPEPDDEAIGGALTNLCRCGTYQRVHAAIRLASRRLAARAFR